MPACAPAVHFKRTELACLCTASNVITFAQPEHRLVPARTAKHRRNRLHASAPCTGDHVRKHPAAPVACTAAHIGKGRTNFRRKSPGSAAIRPTTPSGAATLPMPPCMQLRRGLLVFDVHRRAKLERWSSWLVCRLPMGRRCSWTRAVHRGAMPLMRGSGGEC